MSVALRFLEGSDAKMGEVAAAALRNVGSKLTELIDRTVVVAKGRAMLCSCDALGKFFEGGVTVSHASLGEPLEGRVRFLLPQRSALTLAGYMRMASDDVIMSNRNEGKWSPECDEAFDEVSSVLFAGFDSAVRDTSDVTTSVRPIGYEVLDNPNEVGEATLGNDALVSYGFTCRIADFSPETGYLLLPLEAAEAINGQPLRYGEDADAGDDDIEAAPIRGTLSAYLGTGDVSDALRRSCKRVGLRLDRRPRNEVPNPAAFKDQVVLIEIDRGQEKRFDWCRRLKTAGNEIQTVLLLREPTRVSVAMAFRAQADAVLGSPTTEGQLSRKLESLLVTEPVES